MKLRNKLLPFATVLATATTIAPFVTACTSGSSQKAYCDITQPITPSKKAAVTTKAIDQYQALDMYVEAVKNDPTILQQDIWYYEHNRLPERLVELEHYNFVLESTSSTQVNSISNVTANIICDDINVKTVDYIDVKGQKNQFHTISMTLGYEFSFKALSIESNPRLDLTETYKFSSTYTNIPLLLTSQSRDSTSEKILGNGKWWVSADLTSENIPYLLTFVPDWSLSYSYDKEYSYTYQEGESITTGGNKNSYGDTFTRLSQIYSLSTDTTLLDVATDVCLDFSSYYMSDVLTDADGLWVNPDMSAEFNVNVDANWPYYIKSLETGQTIDLFKIDEEAKEINGLKFLTYNNLQFPILEGYISTSKNNVLDSFYSFILTLQFNATNHTLYADKIRTDFWFENALVEGEKIYITIPADTINYTMGYTKEDGTEKTLNNYFISQPIRITLNVKLVS